MERRDFLAAAGVLATSGINAEAQTSPSSADEKRNLDIVAGFCKAWATRDAKQILAFFADDGVYRMSETTPPVTGPAGVMQRLGSWIESSDKGIEFEILQSWAKGSIVVNHRIDRFMSSTRPLTWEGVGVFYVTNGKIKEWSDYTMKVDRPAGVGAPV